MTSIGLPVPQGFVVTAQAFRRFLQLTKLEDSIFDILEKLDVDDNDALNATADLVKSMVSSSVMPEVIKKEIIASYQKMGSDTVVAVRSSATAEDLPDASFAGQQDTYLNILGETDLLQAVQDCWASLYGGRAIYYRAKQGFDDRTVNIAVVVQQLVFSEKAGVMFSSHPISGAATVIIEGSWGLGEAIVSGTVSPDNYVYDRKNKRITPQRPLPTNLLRSFRTVTKEQRPSLFRRVARMFRFFLTLRLQNLLSLLSSLRSTIKFRRIWSGEWWATLSIFSRPAQSLRFRRMMSSPRPRIQPILQQTVRLFFRDTVLPPELHQVRSLSFPMQRTPPV